MWWFLQRPERIYRQRLRNRLAIAQRLTRDVKVRRLASENQTLCQTALNHISEDETAFERLFGEPLPPPLRHAVGLERDAWTNLTNQLNQITTERSRKTLRAIQRMLALQEEILTSPLSRRFATALDRIKREELGSGRALYSSATSNSTANR